MLIGFTIKFVSVFCLYIKEKKPFSTMQVDENGMSVLYVYLPHLHSCVCAHILPEVSQWHIASKLFFAIELHFISKKFLANLWKEYRCSDKKDSLSSLILEV